MGISKAFVVTRSGRLFSGQTNMIVEIQFFDGCPNHKPAVELARRVIAEEGVKARIVETNVPDNAAAHRIGFTGSPSIRVDGVDIEPNACAVVSFACRRYAGGIAGLEPVLRAAIRSAV